MDDIDRQLVSRLVRDGREPYADLARAVGLSLSATKRRVDRLVADGAIRGFTAVVDPVVMGWALSASVELFTTGTVPFERMRRDLDAMPEVVSASTVSGGADAMLRVALERLGYAVDVAFDGPSALEKAAAFAPGTVLLDIGLPVMDGYEVARRLRAAQPPGQPLRLLALTGYGQAADRERALAAGFEHHIVKPIELQDLQEWLARAPPQGHA